MTYLTKLAAIIFGLSFLVLTTYHFTVAFLPCQLSVSPPITPKFHNGDCFHIRPALQEPWEKGTASLGKVAQVGTLNYLVYRTGSLYKPVDGHVVPIGVFDPVAVKVECPK